VRPAETVREVGPPGHAHCFDRALEQALACEPIVVIAEAVNRMLARKRRLLLKRFAHTQIIETEIPWQMRLVMSDKIRLRPGNVGPLTESLAPPLVVLRDRMELRQVERNRSYRRPGLQWFIRRSHFAIAT